MTNKYERASSFRISTRFPAIPEKVDLAPYWDSYMHLARRERSQAFRQILNWVRKA